MKTSFTRIGKPLKPVLPHLDKIIQQELAKEKKAVLREYQITVRTWNKKPDFKADEDSDGVTVGTDDKIYGYVDDGTKPHVIKARRAPTLRFYAGGFVSKTVPGRLNPRAGRSANQNLRRPLMVNHPGFAGREFTKQILERSRARFARNLQKRIKQDLAV